MAVDAHVHAHELLGPSKRQDSPPAPFGTRKIARAVPHQGLTKGELGVVGIEPQARGSGDQRLLRLFEHLVRAGQPRIELASHRVGRGRTNFWGQSWTNFWAGSPRVSNPPGRPGPRSPLVL
jgi:hypothetical protein